MVLSIHVANNDCSSATFRPRRSSSGTKGFVPDEDFVCKCALFQAALRIVRLPIVLGVAVSHAQTCMLLMCDTVPRLLQCAAPFLCFL